MKKFGFIFAHFTCSLAATYGLMKYLVFPTIYHYPRLTHIMARFQYSEQTLSLFIFLSLFLFFIQLAFRKFSVFYIYLFYPVYFALLFTVLFVKTTGKQELQLSLFQFVKTANPTSNIEALLNFAYFVPLGMLYGLRANLLQTVILAAATVLGIETIQYCFQIGVFDVDDIILNVAGCLLGFFIVELFRKHKVAIS